MSKSATKPFIPYLTDAGFTFGLLKIGVCFDKEAFHKEMERLGVPETTFTPEDCGGCCTAFHGRGGHYAVITLVPNFHKHMKYDLMTLVHESVHVKQALCDRMSEEAPSAEFEAYVVEAVAAFCTDQYLLARQRHEASVSKVRERKAA